MTDIRVSADAQIDASSELVYRIIADYHQHHPRILPAAFSSFAVEAGGVGEGTIIRFDVTVGGRTRSYHQRVTEPSPGRILREEEIDGDQATTFTVTPANSGCQVRIETTWPPSGIRSIVERLVAPRMLQPIYKDELAKIQDYARTLEGR